MGISSHCLTTTIGLQYHQEFIMVNYTLGTYVATRFVASIFSKGNVYFSLFEPFCFVVANCFYLSLACFLVYSNQNHGIRLFGTHKPVVVVRHIALYCIKT